MTETVRGDKKKFEIWLHGRAEVYTIQVSTRAGRGVHDTGEYMGGPRCTRYR